MSCTCRDDQYQLCGECSLEQDRLHAPLLCASCDDVISSGTLCLECSDDIALEDNKAFAIEVLIDTLTYPDLTNKCCVCRAAIIDTDMLICIDCAAL